ncbi:ppsC [Symbiodinium sp. CCMP2592]|nr:ppsC [Symbiodinium sp. CCMP2592]
MQENPDEINVMNPKMNQRHTSFVDGIELFDDKYLEISNNEAVTMDPLQRQVLEVGGALLQQMGISKKVSNKRSHHVGVSVGVDKADFPTLGVMTGGNNALAIIANRFSFVFNLKGPNYICDTACSASLTATHLAKQLLLDRVWDVLDFHVATGTHLCLSPGPWVGCALGHMTSPQGRCFTFDSTANGYLRGEGTSGMILRYGDYEQASTIYRASQVGQDGRSASLTAPNGPAQEEIISRAIREAKMTPPESTCWECHGTGTSLGAVMKKPSELTVQEKAQAEFEKQFGVAWSKVMEDGLVFNAMDGAEKLGISPDELGKKYDALKKGETIIEFGGGCGKVDNIYVTNGFYRNMRSKFTAPGTSIYCYEVEWPADKTKLEDFLAPTEPAQAPAGSLRSLICKDRSPKSQQPWTFESL